MSQSVVDGARPVRPGEELDVERLTTYLDGEFGVSDPVPVPLVVEQFPGGYSNLTYLLRRGAAQYVLRRPPFGAQVATGHDMGREYRVLRGLCDVFPPAPRPLAYCEDLDVIGAPFYVMQRRQGMILRKSLPKGISIDAGTMTRMCESLIDTLADLHAVDVEAAGLADLGKPQGYVQRQVEGWLRRYGKAQTDEIPEVEQIAAWLRDNMPADSGGVIVHNDFKFDNVIVDPDDPTRIVAVLDWEMCTLGDPLMDLGTTLGYWVEAGDDPRWQAMAFGPTTAPGALTRRALADRYGQRTGRDVSNMLYYYCFALVKIAVIAQQIYVRFKQGHTKDPRFAQLGVVVRTLMQMAVQAAETGRY